ncbi:MAG: DUF4830 domain-containing protein [Firmicutes bacterium]|nr:DUF4830 domain-containing protein [Bacillota bacterium]
MKHKKALYIVSAAAVAVSAVIFALFSDGGVNGANVRFLGSLGIEVQKKPVEVVDIRIPEPFDLVYESYNDLQIEGGFDLRPYAGMSGTRYTYIVTNFPEDVGEEVRANVICVGRKQVGGDVMTVSLGGFMLPLNFMPEYER